MNQCRLFSFSYIIVFLTLFCIHMFADDHIVQEQSRTYMGRTIPPRKIDIWICKDRMYYSSGFFIMIKRTDLKKQFILNVRQKRYMEEPIKSVSESQEKKEEIVRIHELGFNYRPVFDWIVRETSKEKVIDGRTCRKFILNGDADYAEEVRELWVTKDVPIDMERYFDMLVKPDLDDEWLRVYAEYPELKHSLAVESQHTVENAIAPTMIWKFKVITLESKDPPEGLYDIPEGYTKVSTRKELYRR